MNNASNSDFLSAFPTFTQGVHAMHADLVGVTLLLAFIGLLFHVVRAQVTGSTRELWPTFVRLLIVSILVTAFESWGDALMLASTALSNDMGVNANGNNIFQDFQAAVAKRLGTAQATQNATQLPSSGRAPGTATPSPLPDPNQATTGIRLTHYAYPGDSTPDSNSAQGIGAGPYSSPGSLMALSSAALSASVAKQYNLSLGQQFTIGTSGGQSVTLVYADVVPDTYQGQPVPPTVDIYDPNGQIAGGNNFMEQVTSISPGDQILGPNGAAQFLPAPTGVNVGDWLLWAFTLIMCWLAELTMLFMWIAQQLLYLIEIAISPIFIGMLMIPALQHLARRFFLIVAGICLWNLAWSVCDLVTKWLIGLAVNPAGNGWITAANIGGMLTGPLSGLIYLLAMALWVIGSTLAAPIFIGIMFGIGGGTATSAVFGATLGAAAARAGASGAGHAGRIATTVIGHIGSNGNSVASRAMRESSVLKRPNE